MTEQIYKIGDCIELLQKLPDNSIDLVLTSPPYNTKNTSLGYHPNSSTGDKYYNEYVDNISDKDYYLFLKTVIVDCLRISRYVFWNMQMLTNNKIVFIMLLNDFAPNLKDIFIWNKQSVSQIVPGKLAKGFEFVLLFGKDNSTTFDYNNFPVNRYVPNIQTWFQKEFFENHHATFPLEMAKYFIKNFTKENDYVLDPFLGTGTVLRACRELNRNGIGFEIDKSYEKVISNRLMEKTPSLESWCSIQNVNKK